MIETPASDQGSVGEKGSKDILFVRHCDDAKPPTRFCDPRWRCSHSQAAGGELLDPCVSPEGCLSATSGSQKFGYDDGLWGRLAAFQPQCAVSSPLCRALQTTGLALQHLQHLGPLKVVCHPDIQDIKAVPLSEKKRAQPVGLVKLREFLKDVPGGVSFDLHLLETSVSMLAARRRDAGLAFEEGLSKGEFCDLSESGKAMEQRLDVFAKWLADREESRIVVITHGGVLRRLLGQSVGHGAGVLCRLSPSGVISGVVDECPQRKPTTSKAKQPGFTNNN